MMIFLRNLFLVSFVLATFTAAASPSAPVHGKFMVPKEQPRLSAAAVEKVIKLLPELIVLTKNYADSHKGNNKKNASVMYDKYTAFTKALDALSKKHGFKNTPTMQKMVETTMMTTGFLQSGKTLKQVDEQMLATQKSIMDDSKLSQVQKDSLLQRMAIQVSMVIPSAENIKTVKPFYKRIIAIAGKKKQGK